MDDQRETLARDYFVKERSDLMARVAELEAALKIAAEAMGERRGYSEGWEWKYGPAWDEEDSIVRKALNRN